MAGVTGPIGMDLTGPLTQRGGMAAATAGQVGQLPDGTFRWTAPTGRQYITEPTKYPVWVRMLDAFASTEWDRQ